MAWTYSDWRSQSTAAAKLARLRLHMQEVADQIGAERSGDGYSRGSGSVTQYMTQLQAEEKRLSEIPGVDGKGCTANIRVVRRGRF